MFSFRFSHLSGFRVLLSITGPPLLVAPSAHCCFSVDKTSSYELVHNLRQPRLRQVQRLWQVCVSVSCRAIFLEKLSPERQSRVLERRVRQWFLQSRSFCLSTRRSSGKTALRAWISFYFAAERVSLIGSAPSTETTPPALLDAATNLVEALVSITFTRRHGL